MTDASLTRYLEMTRRGLWSLIPKWARVLLFAEVSATQISVAAMGVGGKGTIPQDALISHGNARRPNQIVDVVLPVSKLLRREIAIPPKAESKRDAIAQMDLVRRTPFQLEDVEWVLTSRNEHRSTHVVQWVAKKSDLQAFRQSLASHGYRVKRFMVPDLHEPIAISDFSQEISPASGIFRRINLGCLILATVACGYLWLRPVWDAQAEIDANSLELERLRNIAVSLRAEVQSLEEDDSLQRQLATHLNERRRAVDALRDITRVLPDSVWIYDFSMVDGQITINGESSIAASDLVLGIMENNSSYAPALAGPVSRTPNDKERFRIVLSRVAVSQ